MILLIRCVDHNGFYPRPTMQVKVADKDRETTAYVTQDGLFEFKVVPFGLCNAPATFQRLMNLVLTGVQCSQCLVYFTERGVS